MSFWTWVWIILVIVVLVLIGLYFWGRKLQTKYAEQQEMIEGHKQVVSIFVIDKKKDHVANLKLPKQVKESLPKLYRKRKMPVVIAKIGPQIQTLMCDQNVYDCLPTKKQIKVEMAGLLIVKILSGKLPEPPQKGMKAKLTSKLKKQQKVLMEQPTNKK